MKEGVKNEIRDLHARLQNKSNWCLNVDCPEDETIQDIATVAEGNADYELSRISVNALYNRAMRWEGDVQKEDWETEFLSEVSHNLACGSLNKDDRPVFEEACTIKFTWL